jgi:predicted DNA-binding transcriptional regulator YafY
MASASSKPIINSAERMLNLVALLTESNRPLTLEEIGDFMVNQYPVKAEARRTAFERDKKSLRKLGVPITKQVLGGNDAGKTAYSIDRTEYKLINFDLTEDELYAFAVTSQLNEDWQKANKRDRTSGMSQKAVNAYRRENPGSKLQTAVTTKPSKLKKGSKSSKRRKSYCSRSRGQMKMHNISCAKTPDKAICKARRRWNC